MLTPELQAQFVLELPEVFLPIHGGWTDGEYPHSAGKSERGRADRRLRTAWTLRVEKKGTKKKRAPRRSSVRED